MEFSDSIKIKPCQHESYCDFSKTICVQADFLKHCQMKDASIEEMHLLGIIKNRFELDSLWVHNHEEELKKHTKALEELKNMKVY